MVKPTMSMNDWGRPELYNVGVKKMSDIQDMVYEYKTFLYKEENNMHESVLHIMYNYRKGNF
jgi:capsid protein